MSDFKMKSLCLTLHIPFDIMIDGTEADLDMLSDDEARTILAEILNQDTYSDGRYAFNEELVENGICNILKQALHYIITLKLQKVYGINCMISTGPNSSGNRAHVEAASFQKEHEPYIFLPSHDWQASITEKDSNAD